jgi:hypothetical protein
MSRLRDGFSTQISFAENPTVKFFEITVQPPGIDGGGANDTTTMRNTALRTMQPKQLKSLTPMTFSASYDSEVFDVDEVFAMINVNQLITILMPDGSEYAFWGFLNSFIPGAHQEGSQPVATLNIIPTNQDDDYVETDPVYTPA